MVQKKNSKIKVAFIITPNVNWIGEFNYFKSLIGAINDLNEKIPIEFYIFTSNDEKNFTQKKYPKINVIKSNILNTKGIFSFIKKILSFFFRGYDPLLNYLLKKNLIQVISHYKPIKGFKNITWFPDFQHVHFPNFFSKREIFFRNKLYSYYLKHSDQLIVSSKSSKKDLIKFQYKKKEINVLNFVPEIDFKKIKTKKYISKEININKKYIFTPNQFWVHKNHICIIEALKILKNKNLKINCIFTGSNYDHREPNHYENLRKKIEQYGLNDQIKYLGILQYNKIINLLYHSNIIINPSLFEGWSTVVEEAKILDKKIILSNLDVHIEQNPKKGIFFNPKNPKELADKIERSFLQNKKKSKDIKKIIKNYKSQRYIFIKNYINIVNKIKIN